MAEDETAAIKTNESWIPNSQFQTKWLSLNRMHKIQWTQSLFEKIKKICETSPQKKYFSLETNKQ